MASIPAISIVAAKAAIDALTALLNGGSGPGYLEVRTGAPPTSPDDASTGTLLGTLELSDPAFAAAAVLSAGLCGATAHAVTGDLSADASGVIGHVRAFDSNGVCVLQGTGGLNGVDDADFLFTAASVVIGSDIELISWVVKLPQY